MLSSDVLRAHLSAILLSLINEADRYGYELFSEICQRTDERLNIKEATLYAILQRMEKQELISSYQGTISNGSKRRYYHITQAGKEYLNNELAMWQETKEIINIFLGGCSK